MESQAVFQAKTQANLFLLNCLPELVRVVEGAETERLEQRHLQLLGSSLENGPQHAVAEVGLPLQLPSRILSVIELLEDLLQEGKSDENILVMSEHQSLEEVSSS